MVSFECECGKQLKVKEGLAGKLGKCSHCGRQVRIPGPRAMTDTPLTPGGEPVSGPAGVGRGFLELQQGFYYRAGDKTLGPVDMAELVALVRKGVLHESNKIWYGSGGDWALAGDVPELRQVFRGDAPFAQPGTPDAQPQRPAVEGGASYGSGVAVFMPVTGALIAGADGALNGAFGAPSFAYRRYAGFWVRCFAVVIDYNVLLVPWMVILSLVSWMSPDGSQGVGGPFDFLYPSFVTLIVALLVQTAGAWLYFSMLESSPWQATLGKRALGIFVTDALGARLTLGQATARYFLSVGSIVVFGVVGVFLAIVAHMAAKPGAAFMLSGAYATSAVTCTFSGYLLGAFTRKRQTLHDLLAKTVVIYGRRD